MTPAELLRLRLRNQLLDRSTASTPAQVVARLGAVQAQDYAASLWAIGARLPGSTQPDVEAAIASGDIVRSWPMRGTLHLMAKADVRWLVRLAATRAFGSARARWAQLGLTDADFARGRDVLSEALAGRRTMTRRDIHRLLDEHGVLSAGQRGIHVINRLAMEGVLCVGPRVGTETSFVLLEDWVPPQPLDQLERDDALGELARRYLAGHAPATDRDLAWWSGLGLTDVRRGLAAAGAGRLACAGTTYWLPADGPDVPGGPDIPDVPAVSQRTLLVPAFDEIFLGYGDRTLCVPRAHHEHVVPGGNGVFLPMVLRHGRGVATWRRRSTARGVTISVTPLPGRRAPDVAADARRYARFVGAPVRGTRTEQKVTAA